MAHSIMKTQTEMAASTVSSSSVGKEKNTKKSNHKSKARQSKRCYMHIASVRREKTQAFTITRWNTYRKSIQRWLQLVGECRDVAESHKQCLDLEFESIPEDAAFHPTCYRRFIDRSAMTRAERRLVRERDKDGKTSKDEPPPPLPTLGPRKARRSSPYSSLFLRAGGTQQKRCITAKAGRSELGPSLSSSGPLLPPLCIICRKKKKYIIKTGKQQIERLSLAKSLTAGLLQKAAELKDDNSILLHIQDKNCVVLKVPYHETCYQEYTWFMSVPERQWNKETGRQFDVSYKVFCERIIRQRLLVNQEVLRRGELRKTFIDLVKSIEGLDASHYRQDVLKKRLSRDFPQLVFHTPQRQNICELVFAENLVVEKVMDMLPKPSDVSNNSAVEDIATQHKEPVSDLLNEHDYIAPPLLHRDLLQTDDLSLLYTGLPLDTFNFLADQLTKGHINTFQLDVRDQILMTLMKLRLNLLQSDLAERFHVSQSGVGKVMSVWLDIMEEKMRCFIPWLPRKTILATLPQCFKELYPSTTCVINCSEIQLHKTQMHSHYNGQNTIKHLVAFAPCGLIMFVSATYGGRCSDKYITSDSGFLEYLRPGDVVMADEGFDVSDLLHERQVELLIPALSKKGLQRSEDDTTHKGLQRSEEDTTHNGMQLSEENSTHTRGTTDVLVHVEKIIRRLKNFRILSQTIPFNLVHQCDKILKICAALSNLQGDIPEDEND